MTEYVPVHKKLVLSDIFECTKYKFKLSSSMCTVLYCLIVSQNLLHVSMVKIQLMATLEYLYKIFQKTYVWEFFHTVTVYTI